MSQLRAFDLALAPDKRSGSFVVCGGEVPDRLRTAKARAGQGLSGKDAEPDFDLIKPARRSRREVESNIGVRGKPSFVLLMGAAVVEGAAVINVASISGWSPQLAMSGQYGAAKAALIFDTERWALEFVPYGIRVNTISPGSILVEGNGWDRYRLANPGYFEDYVRYGFPMGRLGTAEEVADVIVFLASPRAHWINGRNIPVDGLEQPHAPLDRRPY
jgi:NAD(P)-dependent dehydrogenase (short-subunit alcohol dehydrogenase family)